MDEPALRGTKTKLVEMLDSNSKTEVVENHEMRFSETLGAITKDVVTAEKNHGFRKTKNPIFRILIAFASTATYRISVTAMTILALFIYDITLAFLPMSMDQGIIAILFVVSVFFGLDIAMNSTIRVKYLFSFYFWLDLIGTLSIIPDIVELMDISSIQGEDPALEVSELAVARAGRAGRLARSAGTLRLAKFARFFRVVRLIRVVRIFRVMKLGGKAEHETDIHAKPSKIGIYLSDLITKRVIVIVICLILAIPQLNFIPDAHTTVEKSMVILHSAYMSDSEVFQESKAADAFVEMHKPLGLAFLQIGHFVPFDEYHTINGSRLNEFVYYSSEDLPQILLDLYANDTNAIQLPDQNETIFSNETISFCYFNIREEVKTQAIYQMLLAIFIVFVFAMGSFAISHETNLAIVKPIERMTVILKKLAGTVFALSMIEDYEDDDDYDGEDDDDMETEMLEHIVYKMASIFNVTDSADDPGLADRDHGMKLNLGISKVAPEGQGGAYLVKTSKLQYSNNDIHSNTMQRSHSIHQPETIRIQLPDGTLESLMDHPELAALDTLLRKPAAAYELKMFMNQNLNIENFLFWQEVERFQIACLKQAESIFKTYISKHALSEINIVDELRTEVENELYNGDPLNIRICMFAKVQAEVFNLMKHNAHYQFLKSPYAVRYILKKKKREDNYM